MKETVADAKADSDSVGGVIECFATGIPAGLGDPIFDGIENRIAQIIFGIPAIKGLEFGNGFQCSSLRGSQNNDAFICDNGAIFTQTNNAGGILGGITTGMPIVFRVAVKPTPSIGKIQQSINLVTQTQMQLQIKGRHDPCIVPRAVPVVEAVTAIVLLDLLLEGNHGTF
jgi:chorismate synthase